MTVLNTQHQIIVRKNTISLLDRIWEKVPAVSEEETQVDIEQAIAEGRAEITRKRSKLSP